MFFHSSPGNNQQPRDISRPPRPFEAMLNGADGMDSETFCDCSTIYAVPSSGLFNKRGLVSVERRRAIRALLRDAFLLNATE